MHCQPCDVRCLCIGVVGVVARLLLLLLIVRLVSVGMMSFRCSRHGASQMLAPIPLRHFQSMDRRSKALHVSDLVVP